MQQHRGRGRPMEDRIQHMLDGLLEAIQAESYGQHFYRMAAQATRDAKGVEAFELLAMEEQQHGQYLKRQYQSLLETGNIDRTASLGIRTVLSGDHPLFSPQLHDRIADAHFEMTALAIGIQLELNAVAHYRAQADAATDPEVKDFYQQLVEWESGHLNALSRQQESLKHEYWSDNRFAPF